MDFNSILMSALIGAVSVGGAVGIGGLLKKSLPERFHQIVTYGAIAVGVAVMTLANNWYRENSTGDQIEAALDEGDFSGGALFKVIKADFPEEYDEFLQKARKVRASEDGRRIGAELTTGLRHKYGEQLRASSTTEIRELFEDDRELTKLILERKGWEACNAYLMVGGSAVVDLGEPFVNQLEKNALRLFEVLATVKNKSLIRSAPAEDDWGSFIEYWQSKGASQEDLSLFVTPDADREETCSAYISFYDTLSVFEGDAAERLLTEVVVIKVKS